MSGCCTGYLPIVICIAFVLVACFIASRCFSGRFQCGTSGAKGGSVPQDSASEILKTRYAKGEINREEFERMNQEIK
jgi:uncharacterized membrane protein